MQQTNATEGSRMYTGFGDDGIVTGCSGYIMILNCFGKRVGLQQAACPLRHRASDTAIVHLGFDVGVQAVVFGSTSTPFFLLREPISVRMGLWNSAKRWVG